VAEWIAFYRLGLKSSAYHWLFWVDNVMMVLLLFLVVIAFAYQALEGSPLRPKARKAFAIIFVTALVLPFTMLHDGHSKQYGYFTNLWFNHVIQIWNFGAAIMNLVLWAALLSNRRRDPNLVTMSIGVGLATASVAIGRGVREWFPESHRWPVDTFMIVAHIAGLLVWCWAFRPGAESGRAAKPPAAASQNALSTPS
jgi:hypothetical protein